MEFLLFLSGIDKEILALIRKADFTVEENTPLCLLGKKFFGFLKREQRSIVICTKNAIDIRSNLIAFHPDQSMTCLSKNRSDVVIIFCELFS